MSGSTYCKSLRVTRNKLKGFMPVWKEPGVSFTDLLDLIKLSVQFDTGVRFSGMGLKFGGFPNMHTSAEGIYTVAFGHKVGDLRLLKHSTTIYRISAKFGESTSNCHADGEVKSTKEYDHITRDELVTSLKSFEGEYNQARLWKEYTRHRLLHELQRDDKPSPLRSVYHEGRAPRKVKCLSAQLLSMELPHFSFELNCSSLYCVYRLLYELSRKLNTESHITRMVKETEGPFDRTSCLKHYELHFPDMVQSLEKNSEKYREYIWNIKEETKSHKIERHVNPWT